MCVKSEIMLLQKMRSDSYEVLHDEDFLYIDLRYSSPEAKEYGQ
jgi:hypothetical protein